ncbi:hypothetical protein ACOME3_000803 [Neoechinorhynchus agilis]
MDITRSNFVDSLAKIRESLTHATFVSFDTEFTSVSAYDPKFRLPLLTEDFSKRYPKLARLCADSTILQFGFTVFSSVDHQNDFGKEKYKVQSFNIWTYPRSVPEFQFELPRMFTCQASSIEFLSVHGFDFNKCFLHGIGLLREQEREILQQLYRKPYYLNQETFCAINKWDQKEPLIINVPSNRTTNLYAAKISEVYGFDVQFLDKLNELKLTKKECSAIEPDFRLVNGLFEVVNEIRMANVPIVCHNGMLDIMLTIQHCFEPLSLDSPEKFKEQCRRLFPRIFDTKHILDVIYNDERKKMFPTNQSTSLGPIFRTMCIEKSVKLNELSRLELCEPDEGNEFSYTKAFVENPKDMKGQAHDAGFDAFMCGCLFVQLSKMSSLLGVSFDKFENKINLIKAACPYVDLRSRKDIVHKLEVQSLYIPNGYSFPNLSHILTPFQFDVVSFDPNCDYLELMVRCGKEGRNHLLSKHGNEKKTKYLGLTQIRPKSIQPSTTVVGNKTAVKTAVASIAIVVAAAMYRYFNIIGN